METRENPRSVRFVQAILFALILLLALGSHLIESHTAPATPASLTHAP